MRPHPVRRRAGYIFIMMYGVDSDWVKSISAAGTARLTIDDEEIALVSPRLVSRDVAWQQMAAATKEPPKFLRVTEFLQMDSLS